jgi:hypothetical protein
MTRDPLIAQETTDHVIGASFEVYRCLGVGVLERIYADALVYLDSVEEDIQTKAVCQVRGFFRAFP